ncbi:Uncharacterised protein [Vibrio cholerae]|nr:Uncharacterised protein [Vibrio cholerae]
MYSVRSILACVAALISARCCSAVKLVSPICACR